MLRVGKEVRRANGIVHHLGPLYEPAFQRGHQGNSLTPHPPDRIGIEGRGKSRRQVLGANARPILEASPRIAAFPLQR